MARKLVFAILLLITGLVVGGFFLPASYHVERSISVQQSPSVIFTLLNSYRTFNEWSPWVDRDPDARFLLSGPESGVGARLDWSGDPRLIGQGWQEIIASEPYRRIGIRLDFADQGTATSRFLIEPAADGFSRLTWVFETDVTEGKGVIGALMGRYFGLFLDRWVGADCEQGLADFSRFAESFPVTDFADAPIEIVSVEPRDILFVSGSTSQQAGDVAAALADAFEEIISFMSDQGIEMAGQPMAITRSWDENGYRFDAALPVSELPGVTTGKVQSGQSPAGRAARYTHTGPYDQMLDAYDQLAAYMAANGLRGGVVSWEHYISDPGETDPGDLVTHIYFLLED